MKQKPLQIHCVFQPTGDDMRQIILRSFSLYVRRARAAYFAIVV